MLKSACIYRTTGLGHIPRRPSMARHGASCSLQFSWTGLLVPISLGETVSQKVERLSGNWKDTGSIPVLRCP